MLRFSFFVHALLIFVNGEMKWHSSQVSLMQLYDLQKEHFTAINSYLESETKRLEELKNFLAEWQDYKLPTKETYLENHFNTINLMTRINTQFRKLEYLMDNNMSKEALKQIDEHKDLSEDNIILASQSLRRLQLFYMIPASEMAAGKFENKTIGDPMTSCECYVILENCLNNYDLYGVLDWAVEVFNKWKNESQPKCVNIDKLILHSFTSSMYSGFNSPSLRDLNGLIQPKNVDDLISYYHLMRNDFLILNETRTLKLLDFNPLNRIYSKLCKRGESKKILTKYSKCRYQSKNSHYRILMPFKEEDLNNEPDIKIYHDILYDNEIKKLKMIASRNMEDGLIANNQVTDRSIENIRSCKLCWMKRKTVAKQFSSLDNRVESITGLSTGTAEPYQIVNYGLGGHFMPHYDAFMNYEALMCLDEGNRLLTVLFYLTDVEYGGSTVFPMLNIVSPPKKGAALVFYNINASNGKYFMESLHGACPVLVGSKWITTRWIYESGQNMPYNWKLTKPKFYQEVFKIRT